MNENVKTFLIMEKRIQKILKDSIQVKETIVMTSIAKIAGIADAICDSLNKGGKLIVFGNGGSAADAQHIAAELVGRFQKERKALAALALSTNTSILTALANDYTYDIVFTRQIEALAKEDDVILAISTSGKARNTIEAVKTAKKIGLKTIALTGGDGGELSKIADLSLIIPSKITARIQEAHITIGHIICELVEDELSKNNS